MLLRQRSPPQVTIGQILGAQRLQRTTPTGIFVPDLEYITHAAFAQRLQDAIPVRDHGPGCKGQRGQAKTLQRCRSKPPDQGIALYD